ncbi:hypothetical protein [Actinomadura sp. B10D3]|uniref:hypothetical protein n=1 Tax=Actinomadura sp. B10D3 TaxID=3153557 RepID=UPI00325DA13B
MAILRLPDDYDGSPRPVLFHFPGLIETPWMAEFFGRMAHYARTRGFIMITPEHHGIGWQGVAGGAPAPDVDDPGFVNARHGDGRRPVLGAQQRLRRDHDRHRSARHAP